MSRPNDALEVIEMLDKSGPESYMNPLAQYDQLKDELRRMKALIYADLVPHGRWRNLGCDEYVCSECGFYCEYPSVMKCGYNFCPNCGAKMDGGKDNESD